MITKNDRFSEIISQNKSLASVIERFGIEEKDYHKTIEEVSGSIRVDADFMVAIIKGFDQDNQPDKKLLTKFPLETILDYLKKTHQYYLNKRLPEIELSLHDIIRRYHHSNSVLFALGNLFIAYKRKLTEHIQSEEEELFPYIEFLIQQLKGDFDYSRSRSMLQHFSIQHFEESHTNVEEDIARTRDTILRYSPENTFAMSYRIFLNQLELFETDLHRHSIIEDEILVPKAQCLEALVKGMVDTCEGFISDDPSY
jgi:regulator of cell morphogenesis and NO signaling